MDRMRPMSEAPRDGTEIKLWVKGKKEPFVCGWHVVGGVGVWMRMEDPPVELVYGDERYLLGWTPLDGELEPDAPEPEAQTMPPSMERATFRLFSAAQESVALGQPLAQFQALAGVAHAQATKRAARVGR